MPQQHPKEARPTCYAKSEGSEDGRRGTAEEKDENDEEAGNKIDEQDTNQSNSKREKGGEEEKE